MTDPIPRDVDDILADALTTADIDDLLALSARAHAAKIAYEYARGSLTGRLLAAYRTTGNAQWKRAEWGTVSVIGAGMTDVAIVDHGALHVWAERNWPEATEAATRVNLTDQDSARELIDLLHGLEVDWRKYLTVDTNYRGTFTGDLLKDAATWKRDGERLMRDGEVVPGVTASDRVPTSIQVVASKAAKARETDRITV